MSAQISTLIAKVNSLQNAITPEVTSSIPTRRAYNRLSVRKRMAREPRPVGPVSVGGAPLFLPRQPHKAEEQEGEARGFGSRAQAADKGLEPASTRRVFLLDSADAAAC